MLSLVLGCTQRETDIGLDAVNNSPQDTFTVDSLTADSVNFLSWNPKVSNGRGASLQVGDAANFYAFSTLRFNPAAALPESVRVDSIIMRLVRNRIWPETGAPGLQVRIREILERWTQDSLLAGYLPGRETYPILDSLLIPADETVFTYTIPESLWTRWIAHDSLTWGLSLEPKSSGTLLDFYSSEHTDSLMAAIEIYGVQWRQVDSVWTDTTLYVKQAAEHDAYLTTNSAVCDSTRLCLSQGFPQRAALYFPLDSISAHFQRSVAHAELTIWSDTLHSANMLYSHIGLLFKDGTLSSRAWLTYPDSARGGIVAISSSAFNSTGEYVTFDVTGIVPGWVSNPVTNTGFQVLTSEENGHLTRQVFHSPLSEDLTKRPRLKLWLTEEQ